MRFARWIDHLPPWLAWGAVVSAGVYEPIELVAMALPLLAAALVEWRHWGLWRWRRLMEIFALVLLLALLMARIGLIPALVHMLFLLCGIRLVLPREIAQRRQILLMGFLIWLTTAISTMEFDFLVWSLVWLAGASLVFMQQSWEASASLRRGPILPPPYFRVLRWSFASICLGAVFFLILPRLTLGLRAFPWGISGLTAARAGLSDLVDLGAGSDIQPNGEVVMRIIPPPDLLPAELAQRAKALELMRGVVLEIPEGMRWKPGEMTPPPRRHAMEDLRTAPGALDFEIFVAPNPRGILTLPYGQIAVETPPGMPIQPGFGGSLRWMFPTRRPISLPIRVVPSTTFWERPPKGSRLALLLHTGPEAAGVERWSRRMVPEELLPEQLADRLSSILKQFRYTLDNPSGRAENPLEDFLERSHAGHCEYFASALATMLRRRGVPARVVNGYRLGPWIAEGGYWLITQDEAHSWVEYFDPAVPGWRIADPTPAAPPSNLQLSNLMAILQRWMDAARYRWDRYVVRFSGQDQMEGLDWIRDRAAKLSTWHPTRQNWVLGIAILLTILLLTGRTRLKSLTRRTALPGGIQALKPLLRTTQKFAPPTTGETARAWLMRLVTLRPDRAIRLRELAEEVDSETYGARSRGRAAKLAKEESRLWRRRPG